MRKWDCYLQNLKDVAIILYYYCIMAESLQREVRYELEKYSQKKVAEGLQSC